MVSNFKFHKIFRRVNTLLLFFLLSFRLHSQTDIQVQVPENYELSNVILALTAYGKTDTSEVQKKSSYYKEMISFFEPVKDHPLLRKVNYSRELWEEYLSFRTDAIAFSFIINTNELKRNKDFKTNPERAPFDTHVQLINDFIKQSNFRTFYKNHKGFYDSIISNYRSYYMINEMMAFLKKECGNNVAVQKKSEYKIILSPLVGRLSCRRDISKSIVADFPVLAVSLINQDTTIDRAEQAVKIHSLFTEAAHGSIKALSSNYEKEVNSKIHYYKWYKGSDYTGIAVFNRYMCYAVYDLFIKKKISAIADSVSTQWHYKNGERGFFASSAFAKKLVELYQAKTPQQTIANLYPKILLWCSEFQKEMVLPTLVSPTEPRMIHDHSNVSVELVFSEPMNEKETMHVNIISLKDKQYVTNPIQLTKENNNISWSDNGKKLSFTLQLQSAEQSSIQMNWWGCKTAFESKKGIMLKVFSKIVLNQEQN